MSIEALVAAIIAMVSQSPGHARVHVESARAVSTKYNFPVELILGAAYVESRYYESALSRLECEDPKDTKTCVRKVGAWPGNVPPPKAQPDWYCGPLQAGGWVTWAECNRMRVDVAYGYERGAKELALWWNDPRCAALPDDDRLRCMLAGHNAGNAGVAVYKTLPYVEQVLKARDQILKSATFEEQKRLRPES